MKSKRKTIKTLLRAGVLSLCLTAVCSAAFGGSVTVFTTDFNAGAPPEFSGVTTTEGVQGYAGLGTGLNVFGGDFLRNTSEGSPMGTPGSPTMLTLTGLPPHNGINLNFLLAIIDSWDGETCFYDPDIFNVRIDGNLIFSESFTNISSEHSASYPSPTTPAAVVLAREQQLGWGLDNFDHLDSAYNMGLEPTFQDIPHTSSTLTIEWFASGGGWQGGSDESSKHTVEHYLYMYQENYNLAYNVLRYPNVYGPRQDPHGEAGVVAIFTGQMLKEKPVVINGDGEQERDFVYVGDCARANLMVTTSEHANQIYNLGVGQGTTVNEVYRTLKAITAYPLEAAHGPAKVGETRRIFLDASKAKRELGWGATISLEEGLQKTAEYFRQAEPIL